MSHHHHNHHHHQQQQQQHQHQQVGPNRHEGSSRSRAVAGTGGEIVEVQGGHIIRSIGRKDRHSKVCTSKGPRDRRVRLSANTAIQFYDVQDRLGYDRPSKAVDWLIKNAKSAIDELAELPPWQPTTAAAVNVATAAANLDSAGKNVAVTGISQPEQPNSCYGTYGGSDLLPPSLESDAIADTIKFFFPIATAASSSSSSSSSSYPQGLLLSRASTHTQDLRLSLQSFHDPGVLMHSHSTTTSAPLAIHRNATGGEIFNLPPPQPPQAVPLHPLLVQGGTSMTQRGTLQSNSSQPFRAWNDHVELSGFATSGTFPNYRIPARIHGDDDEHVAGVSGKPPPSSRR